MVRPHSFSEFSKRMRTSLKQKANQKQSISKQVHVKKDRQIKLVALFPEEKPTNPVSQKTRVRPTPSINQIMKHLQRKQYYGEMLTRTPQGFILKKFNDNYNKYAKYFEAKRTAARDPRLNINANRERLRIIQQLGELGFRVAVPRYVELGESEPTGIHKSKLGKQVKTFKVKKMLRYSFPYEDDEYPGKHYLKKTNVPSNNYWARDLYKKINGKRVRVVPNSVNMFGDEAFSVNIGANALFAAPFLRNDPKVEELIRKGTQVYFLSKQGNRYDTELSRAFKSRVFTPTDHIDLFLGVVGKNILVDPFFLKENQAMINVAAKQHRLRIIPIPSSEIIFHPANFLTIKPNEILLERRAIKTKRALEQAGIKVHQTAVPLKANLALAGGVRCMVNEL